MGNLLRSAPFLWCMVSITIGLIRKAGLLHFSSDLAHHGFAVLAFDLRGNGESPAAPRSFGLYEQRDVLGAVDFLHSGPLPYPELGRPHAIAAWGESLGGATVILATANEPSIKAVVSDSSYADVLLRLERDIPAQGHIPPIFHSWRTGRCQLLYGVDYYNIKPARCHCQYRSTANFADPWSH